MNLPRFSLLRKEKIRTDMIVINYCRMENYFNITCRIYCVCNTLIIILGK